MAQSRYLWAVVVAALALAGAADPSAPTLGGTLSPAPFYYDQSHVVNVTNRSTIPVVVSLEGTDGWTLAEATVALDPLERQSIDVTAVGEDGGTIRARFRGTPAGMDSMELVLETKASAVTPDPLPVLPLLLLALLAALPVLWLVRRRTRQDGQGLAEYALIISLVAVVAIVALLFLGGAVREALSAVGNAV